MSPLLFTRAGRHQLAGGSRGRDVRCRRDTSHRGSLAQPRMAPHPHADRDEAAPNGARVHLAPRAPMTKSITVFVCSTYIDLIEERRAAIDSIDRLKLRYESMEVFGARPGRPLDSCLAEVRKSNVIVVIVGHRYGSLVPGDSMSYSEAEYQEAYRLKKLCLIYMRDDGVQVPATRFESDPAKLQALLAFKQTLDERHTIAKFYTPEGLAEQVQSDLLDNIELVEAEEQRRRESSSRQAAFLDEVRDLAVSAIDEGFRQALILSAFRTALEDLRSRPPDLMDRIRGLWGEFPRFGLGRSDKHWPRVFFSYAHSDKLAVEQVAAGLRKYKVRAWIDQREVLAGDSLLDEIRGGLNRTNALVFFASRASLNSQWARHELEYFAANRLRESTSPPIIPVLLEAVELPAFLRDVLYIDMRNGDWRQASRGIAAAVRRVSPGDLRS